jgi:hypothetical protein
MKCASTQLQRSWWTSLAGPRGKLCCPATTERPLADALSPALMAACETYDSLSALTFCLWAGVIAVGLAVARRRGAAVRKAGSAACSEPNFGMHTHRRGARLGASSLCEQAQLELDNCNRCLQGCIIAIRLSKRGETRGEFLYDTSCLLAWPLRQVL